MKSIVKLAVLVAVLFAVFQYGKPHLDRLAGTLGLGDLGGGGSPTLRCIAVAERITQRFSEVVRERATPPVDINRWSGSYRLAEGRLRDAELNCQCDGEPCEMGRQALGMLAAHMDNWNAAVRNRGPVLNSARDLELIYEILDSAEKKAKRQVR